MDEIIKRKPEQAAIVGIGCMFAKSVDAKAFLRLLMRGVDGISDPPPTHEKLRDAYDQDPKKPDHIYCNRGGFLPQVDFDPTEFGIPPHALEATDTSQLLGLLTARQALDDAGYGEAGKKFDRTRTSVILGVTGTQELVIPLGARLGHPIWRRALAESGIRGVQAEEVLQRISDGYVGWQENSFPGLLGNVVAGRIANRLDLGGTNCVVDAACASSMGALHTALLELGAGRSDMVITGGVDTINDVFMHMCFAKTQILSASGDIRPFSQEADGPVLGEGIGMVVLKRLVDARRDGDRIYAVIRGIGSASDGKSPSIYAPRPEGQAMALKRAYQHAGISPGELDLIEAHGTGTRVGDQVEFNALCDVFKAAGNNGHRCALGSVKSNIGHTKAAAGTAGLIKTALALYHKVLPPTLKAERVDAKLKVESSPFYINTRLRPWIAGQQGPRRAGVSAFGFGGSNFHAVLEEAGPEKDEASWDGSVEILAFSGASKEVLAAEIDDLLGSLENKSDWQCIGPLASTLRKRFNVEDKYRLVAVVGIEDGVCGATKACIAARALLADGTPLPPALSDTIHYGSGQKPGGLAFLFPGQGSQYTGMARDLVCAFSGCLSALEEAGRVFDGSETLTDLIYPTGKTDEASLRPTWIAQPAIGAASVAMLEALSQFGVKPDATCGHSYGELVALHAAGWLDREALWKLSVVRGRCMAEAGRSGADPGTMLAVKASLKELDDLCRDIKDLVLANRNSPDQGVLSGSSAVIGQAREVCSERGWPAISLPVSAAFHSPLVSDASRPFGQAVNAIAFTPGPIPVMSNTLGTAYPQGLKDIQRILARHISEPVDFIKNISYLHDSGIRTFVEVGPKTVLSRLTESILKERQVNVLAVDQSAGSKAGLLDLAAAISRLAALGYPLDLQKWEKPEKAKRRPKMVIPLSGANYRSPRRDNVKASPEKAQEATTAKINQGPPHGSETREKSSGAVAPPPVKNVNQSGIAAPVQQAITPFNRDIQMKHDVNPRDNKGLQAALAAVQQGLASLQALQAQTAHAHEKFLETQSEAGRTLGEMLKNAQQLAGITSSPATMEPPAASPLQPPAPEPAEPGFAGEAVSPGIVPSQPVMIPPQAEPIQTAAPDSMPESKAGSGPASAPQPEGQAREIQSSLVAIVSELTG
ncbi:MAG: beta-ketoacyl synthase N-terminal-like domain-containing protein, partial [Desulfosarcinaceae bacterium]